MNTMGIHAKEGDNPIGRFGTGLKYAIAKLLGSACRLTVWRGEEMVLLGTKEIEVRGKKFTLCTMDGESMGFTTELGKDWPFWTTFRELFCNCIDEQGETYSGAPRPGDIAEGRTTIMVEGDEYHALFKDREDYVLTSPPAFKTLSLQAHHGESKNLFYRGVRVYELPKPTLFRYNFQETLSLTEDRTLRSVHEANAHLAWSLAMSSQPDFIRMFLTARPEYYEHSIDFDQGVIMSETFRSVTAELYHSKRILDLNPSVKKLYGKMTEVKRDRYAAVEPTTIEWMQIERAKLVVRHLGVEPDLYPITLVESLGEGKLGQCKEGRIYLSRRALAMGTKMVAGTLYEEILHVRDELPDESRALQNHLIDELMTLIEVHVMKEPI